MRAGIHRLYIVQLLFCFETFLHIFHILPKTKWDILLIYYINKRILYF